MKRKSIKQIISQSFPNLYSAMWGLPLYRKLLYFTHSSPFRRSQSYHPARKALRVLDMVLCLFIHGTTYSEYDLYEFEKKSFSERSKYICDCTRRKYYVKFNSLTEASVFRDKYQTYKMFEKYYGRKIYLFSANNGLLKFQEIINSLGTVIVKPLNASGGFGITKLSHDNPEAIKSYFNDISNISTSHQVVIEECIDQAMELKAFHPESVNTLRIITVVDCEQNVHVIGTLFRIGQGGRITDNGSSGGIMCNLSDEGVIIDSVDKTTQVHYDRHPDSNITLIGFKIPKFNDAKNLAIELSHFNPKIRYCGWDFALTEHGWIMVEGNESAELAGLQSFRGGYKKILSQFTNK